MENKVYEIHKETLPLIPLRGISIFPFMVIHFDVGREKSINALEKAMLDESSILLCTQIDAKVDNPKEEDYYKIGTVSKVKQMLKLPGGNTRVLVEGLSRGKVIERDENGKALRLVGTHTDITLQKEREQQLTNTLEIISEQNSRLLNFAHIVSHNLRSHYSNLDMLLDIIKIDDFLGASGNTFSIQDGNYAETYDEKGKRLSRQYSK